MILNGPNDYLETRLSLKSFWYVNVAVEITENDNILHSIGKDLVLEYSHEIFWKTEDISP